MLVLELVDILFLVDHFVQIYISTFEAGWYPARHPLPSSLLELEDAQGCLGEDGFYVCLGLLDFGLCVSFSVDDLKHSYGIYTFDQHTSKLGLSYEPLIMINFGQTNLILSEGNRLLKESSS